MNLVWVFGFMGGGKLTGAWLFSSFLSFRTMYVSYFLWLFGVCVFMRFCDFPRVYFEFF